MPFANPNATNPAELFQYANEVTNNGFWPLMLLSIFIVSYMALSSRSSSNNAFAGSGFLTGVIAVFMYILGLLQEIPLLLALVVAIGSFALLLFNRD